MKTRNRKTLFIGLVTFSTFSLLLAHEMPVAKPGSAEFEQLKKLAGTWKGVKTPVEKGQKPEMVSTHFKVTSNGSAVEESLAMGTPNEMVDMYTDENGKLAMTHYCAMGNQPHLVLKQSGPKQISLEMGPTAGIDSNKDNHMHALVLEFPDANHLNERWTSYANGKPAEEVVFTMTRVQ